MGAAVAVEATTLALAPAPAATPPPPPTPSMAKPVCAGDAGSITLAVNLSHGDGGSGGFVGAAIFNAFPPPPISLLGGGVGDDGVGAFLTG